MPAFVNVTSSTDSDMGYLATMPVGPGTLDVMSRGSIDFRRLRRLADHGAFFVIRARPDVRFYVASSRPVDRIPSLRSDHTLRFNGTDVPKHWPSDLRRVSFLNSSTAADWHSGPTFGRRGQR